MSRYCKVCGVEIDPRRLAILPDTQTCTQHSTAEKKVAITVQKGEGDHTYNETIIMDHDEYVRYQEMEFKIRANRADDIAHPDEEEEGETPESDEPTELI